MGQTGQKQYHRNAFGNVFPECISVIMLLCGLPAAGKSSLARRIVAAPELFPGFCQIIHICLDDILSEQILLESPSSPCFSATAWKKAQQTAFAVAGATIERAVAERR